MSEATAPMHAVALADVGVGHGWRVVARKEFADHLRSIRFLVLAAILAIVTAATVVAAAGGIRSVASQAMGVPGIFLRLLTIDSPPVPFPFIFVLMNFLGPFLGIAFGFDAISSERSAGTLPRLLAQPIHRDEVIIGKFVEREGPNNFYTVYRCHNYHFKIYGAMFLAQPTPALQTADELIAALPEPLLRRMADWFEAFVPMKQHVLIRFGMWQAILAQPLPEDAELYTVTMALMRYARTVALANTGRIADAESERDRFFAARDAVQE
ncbi:MAG TPA: ABC transporter permease subunit, partial [Acidimicrobiia bacterium]|nr:ABC transporter permease subunit [Acidimicrobiia bacterium]